MHSRTLADFIATELHGAILRGEYPGGTALRINLLAERYETSHMPVRDALRILEGRGLVEIAPHRGARVLELSLDDLRDTFMARAVIESGAVRHAALAMTSSEADRAEKALAEHNEAMLAGDVEAARDAHRRFHFTVYEAANSQWLIRAVEPAWRNSERYLFAAPQGDVDHGATEKEHQAILAACRDHDPERGATAMYEHILRARDRISSLLGPQTP